MRNYSKQREALLAEIRNRNDHPTVEEIYKSLRVKMPRYSLGTVYRNLSELSNNGYILKIPSATGPERYDGCVKPHVHFSCRKCGKVYDMHGIYEKYVDSAAIVKKLEPGASADEIQVTVYGTCAECKGGMQ